MRDSIVENVVSKIGLTISADFDVKSDYRRIPTVRSGENFCI